MRAATRVTPKRAAMLEAVVAAVQRTDFMAFTRRLIGKRASFASVGGGPRHWPRKGATACLRFWGESVWTAGLGWVLFLNLLREFRSTEGTTGAAKRFPPCT